MTNTIPLVGLVLHFRTPNKTLTCLHSQKQEGIDQVVIIDNSEDSGQSLASIQGELSALCSDGFNVQVLNPGRNLGFASGVNLGLSHIAAKCPSHVLLINSDAQLIVGALNCMRPELKFAPIVAPAIAQGNHPPTSPVAYYDRLLGLITQTPKITPLLHVSGCCLLIRQDHAQPPLFDQDFFFYGEDAMFGFQTQQRGIPVRECLQAVVSHATSSSSKNGSLFYEYHMNRAHWLLAKKLARNPVEHYAFILARCLTLPLRALIRSLRFHSLTAWQGLWMATMDLIRNRRRSLTPPSGSIYL